MGNSVSPEILCPMNLEQFLNRWMCCGLVISNLRHSTIKYYQCVMTVSFEHFFAMYCTCHVTVRNPLGRSHPHKTGLHGEGTQGLIDLLFLSYNLSMYNLYLTVTC